MSAPALDMLLRFEPEAGVLPGARRRALIRAEYREAVQAYRGRVSAGADFTALRESVRRLAKAEKALKHGEGRGAADREFAALSR